MMTYISKAVLAGAVGLLIAGCVPEDPTLQRPAVDNSPEGSSPSAGSEFKGTPFVAEELAPLFDICMDKMTSGKALSKAEFTRRGFKPFPKGYLKVGRPSDPSRNKSVSTIITTDSDSCEMSVGRYKGSPTLGNLVPVSMRKAGFDLVGENKTSTVYRRGNKTLFVAQVYTGKIVFVGIKNVKW
jgi:hypothetical protein